jgi:dynein light chain LC8-type
MTEQMQKDAISLAKQAFQKYDKLCDMAEYIRDEFKKKHGGNWQCTLGINGSYNAKFYYTTYSFSFDLGEYWIMLFDY